MTSVSHFRFRTLLASFLLIASIFLQSCNDENPTPRTTEGEGFFIVNEGTFNHSNASLSFYDREENKVFKSVFKGNGKLGLGDQGQSMTIFEDMGYIVVQNDQKIEVINLNTAKTTGKIEDLPSPRYFLGISSTKAYVSDWGADGMTGTVKVVDLSTLKVVKTIETGQGTNKMLKVDNLVYVVNAGGWGVDNTVKIIDTNTDAITKTITVGDNPNGLVQDEDGNIWVTSNGNTVYTSDGLSIDEESSTKPTLSKINSDNSEVFRLEFDEFGYPGVGNLSLSDDGKAIFFAYSNKVWKMSTSADELPESAFKSKSYYSLAVDPANGNLIGGVAPNYTSAGTIEILNGSTGALINTFDVGVAPIAYAFKETE